MAAMWGEGFVEQGALSDHYILTEIAPRSLETRSNSGPLLA